MKYKNFQPLGGKCYWISYCFIFPWFLVRKIFLSHVPWPCLFLPLLWLSVHILCHLPTGSCLCFRSSLCILDRHPFLFYIYHKYFLLRCLTFAALPPFPSINGMHFDTWCWLLSFGKSAYEVKEICFCSCFTERFSCPLFFFIVKLTHLYW